MSDSPSTGSRLHLWSWTLVPIPLRSPPLSPGTGGQERAAPSHGLERTLGGVMGEGRWIKSEKAREEKVSV